MKKAILLVLFLSIQQLAVGLPKALFAIRGFSDQSLVYINLQTGAVKDSIAALGPAANALVIQGQKLYVVNSGGSFIGLNASIQIFDILDILNNVQPLPVVAVSVPDNKNPYDIVFLSDDKAYISYLLDSSIVVFNALNNSLGQRIQVGLGPEGLVVANGKLYVAEAFDPATFAYGTTVSVVSTSTDSVLRTLTVHSNPQTIQLDTLGRVHVVSTGAFDSTGRVSVFDPAADTLVGTVRLGGNISDVVFTSENVGYSSDGFPSFAGLLAYNATTLDTIRTLNNPYPFAPASPAPAALLVDEGDTMYVGRFGSITLYDALTLDSLTRFDLNPAAPYFGLTVFSGETTTDVAAIEGVRPDFLLYQNYPNPFNPSTKIQYTVSSAQLVNLRVTDILGREVAVLANRMHVPGTYIVSLNAHNLSSGTYFCTMHAGNSVSTRKLILTK